MAPKLMKRISFARRSSLGRLTLCGLCLLWNMCYVIGADDTTLDFTSTVQPDVTSPGAESEVTTKTVAEVTTKTVAEVTSADVPDDVTTDTQETTLGEGQETTSTTPTTVNTPTTTNSSSAKKKKGDDSVPTSLIIIPVILLGVPLFILIVCVTRCIFCQKTPPPDTKQPQKLQTKKAGRDSAMNRPWKRDGVTTRGGSAVNRISPTASGTGARAAPDQTYY